MTDVIAQELGLVQLNIERYCHLLRNEIEPANRQQILRLLQEAQTEEARLLRLQFFEAASLKRKTVTREPSYERERSPAVSEVRVAFV
jgi:hypothetical protein